MYLSFSRYYNYLVGDIIESKNTNDGAKRQTKEAILSRKSNKCTKRRKEGQKRGVNRRTWAEQRHKWNIGHEYEWRSKDRYRSMHYGSKQPGIPAFIIHCSTSSRVSEWANKWVVRVEWINGWANHLVLMSSFFVVLDHSAMVEIAIKDKEWSFSFFSFSLNIFQWNYSDMFALRFSSWFFFFLFIEKTFWWITSIEGFTES